ALRDEVEALLRASAQHGDLLDLPENGAATPETSGSSEAIGNRIGPYKLLQKLGEGGMGSVYLAEQEDPVQRRVALKIVKAGLGTAQVLARFEAERQALAVMDHPNIAKVFDAGTTGGEPGTFTSGVGRPYF